MSKLALTPNGAGTGTYTLASPNNNASHTLTLPAVTGTLLTSAGDGSALTSLTSGNLTGALPAIDGSALTGIAAGGFRFISSADVANDATVEFTGFDASKYDAYKLVYSNVIPATDSAGLDMQFSSDGGSTWATGASDYTYLRVGWAGDPVTTYNNTTTTKIRLNVYAIGSAANEDGVSGEVNIHGPHLVKRTLTTGNQVGMGSNNGLPISALSWGRRNSAVATNAVRLLASSGNLESGTITMYGMVNS